MYSVLFHLLHLPKGSPLSHMLQDILASAGTGEQEALERRAVWEPWLTVLMDRIQTMVLSEPGWFGWRMMEYWSKWIQCGLDVTGSRVFNGFTVLQCFTCFYNIDLLPLSTRSGRYTMVSSPGMTLGWYRSNLE